MKLDVEFYFKLRNIITKAIFDEFTNLKEKLNAVVYLKEYEK
jgi:hypothetical protein